VAIRRSSGTRNLADVRRILIVDDHRDSAELMALVLTREGHETSIAYDAASALALAPRVRPDIAFLDIGLPDKDGFELLALLRELPELAPTLFVAVTGYEDLVHSPSSGFDAHLAKPVDLAALESLVSELTHTARERLRPASA